MNLLLLLMQTFCEQLWSNIFVTTIFLNQNLKPAIIAGSSITPIENILLFPFTLALQGGTSSLAPLAASTTSKRDKDRSSKSRKRKSREEHQLYMDPKEAEYAAAAASTGMTSSQFRKVQAKKTREIK